MNRVIHMRQKKLTVNLYNNSIVAILTLSPLITTTIVSSVLLAVKITDIGNERGVQTSRFANVWPEIKQTVIFTQLKLWVAVASHNFK